MPDFEKRSHSGENMVEEIGEDFDKFETWAIENWRLIAWICVGIVAAVAAFTVGMSVKGSHDAKVAETFAAADTSEKLEKALAEYPSASSAGMARMKLAMMQTDKKSYDAALANFRAVSASAGTGEALRSRAALNAAYILEDQGKKEESLAAFLAVAESPLALEDFRSEAYYGAGRLMASKNEVEKAKGALSKACCAHPTNMALLFWSMQAKMLMERLSALAPASADSGKKG